MPVGVRPKGSSKSAAAGGLASPAVRFSPMQRGGVLALVIAGVAAGVAVVVLLVARGGSPTGFRISCSGAGPTGGFPPSALRGPRDAQDASTPPARTLRQFLTSPNASASGTPLPRSGWTLLAQDESAVEYGVVDHSGQVEIELDEEYSHGRWSATDYGGCSLQPVTAGFDPAGFTVIAPVSATSLRLNIEVSTDTCDRGPHDGYDHSLISQTSTRLVLTPLLRPFTGICAGEGTTVSATVRLNRPLGHRVIYDGSTYPPAPAAVGSRNELGLSR